MSYKLAVVSKTVAIGIWDSNFENTGPDAVIGNMQKHSDNLNKQTSQGELSYIYTGIKEDFPLEIFVNEYVPTELLKRYKTHKESFLLKAPSGNLVVEDLLEFKGEGQPLSEGVNKLSLSPGNYKLTIHEFEYDKDLENHIGKGNLDYYNSKRKRNKILIWAALGLAATICFCSTWYYALIPIGMLILHIAISMIDKKFHDTAENCVKYNSKLSVPYFIIELNGQGDIPDKGGYVNRDLTFPVSLGFERKGRESK